MVVSHIKKDDFKEDHHIRLYIGTGYSLRSIRTVGELRSRLERIIEDLPSDESLKISDVIARTYYGTPMFEYVLEDGVFDE